MTSFTPLLIDNRSLPQIPSSHRAPNTSAPHFHTNFQVRLTKSPFESFNGPLLTIPFGRETIDLYIPNEADRKTETASPLNNITPQHTKLQPTTLIMNSVVDLLRNDGLLFGQVLQRAGVDCATFTTHGQLHDSEMCLLRIAHIPLLPSCLYYCRRHLTAVSTALSLLSRSHVTLSLQPHRQLYITC
jgi:acetyl esterase/lipase